MQPAEFYVWCLQDPTQIALTFDDGPSDYTEELLRVLEEHGARATFFLIGENIDRRPETVRKILKARHAIGNHSYHHEDLRIKPLGEIQRQLRKCQQSIGRALGNTHAEIGLFRPPYGLLDAQVVGVARSMGLKTICWSAWAEDWKADPGDALKPKSAERIVKDVASALESRKRGEIVLLHDGWPPEEASRGEARKNRSEVVEATRELLARYRGKREFVSLGPNVRIMEKIAPSNRTAGAAATT
jgi:peptidoglycan/xylan/chitin deacetylase (PgdA/CDA1 family)